MPINAGDTSAIIELWTRNSMRSHERKIRSAVLWSNGAIEARLGGKELKGSMEGSSNFSIFEYVGLGGKITLHIFIQYEVRLLDTSAAIQDDSRCVVELRFG